MEGQLKRVKDQVKRLTARRQELERELARRKAAAEARNPALNEIASGLKKLKKLTATNPNHQHAVQQFEREFQKPKARLRVPGHVPAGPGFGFGA